MELPPRFSDSRRRFSRSWLVRRSIHVLIQALGKFQSFESAVLITHAQQLTRTSVPVRFGRGDMPAHVDWRGDCRGRRVLVAGPKKEDHSESKIGVPHSASW